MYLYTTNAFSGFCFALHHFKELVPDLFRLGLKTPIWDCFFSCFYPVPSEQGCKGK